MYRRAKSTGAQSLCVGRGDASEWAARLLKLQSGQVGMVSVRDPCQLRAAY